MRELIFLVVIGLILSIVALSKKESSLSISKAQSDSLMASVEKRLDEKKRLIQIQK